MGRLELTRTIAAPPELVFAFFVPQRMPYWYGAEMDSCFQVQNGAADFRPGLWVRVSGSLGKDSVGHTFVVSEYQRPRVLEWHFGDAYGVTGSERWELRPSAADGAGGTEMKFTSQYQMPGRIGRLLDWLLTRRALAQRHRDYLQRLARLVEPRPVRSESRGQA